MLIGGMHFAQQRRVDTASTSIYLLKLPVLSIYLTVVKELEYKYFSRRQRFSIGCKSGSFGHTSFVIESGS